MSKLAQAGDSKTMSPGLSGRRAVIDGVLKAGHDVHRRILAQVAANLVCRLTHDQQPHIDPGQHGLE